MIPGDFDMALNAVSRSLHDVGLAAWFGGTLANAVALNAAAGHAGDARSAGAVSNAGWDRWTPVNAAAIGAHLAGSVAQLGANRDRLKAQQGVATMSLVKTGVTVAALAATGYSRVLGRKVSQAGAVPLADGTTPTSETPTEVATAQKQLTVLQWAVPALTGVLVVISALAGEQQRPKEVLAGLTQRFSH
jgi:hypothetical protein